MKDSKGEVRAAVRRMKRGMVVGPHNEPVQVQRGAGERTVHFLTTLLNTSESGRTDVKEQWCAELWELQRGKLMMTIWERAVEAQWRRGEDQRATVCLHADKQLYSGMFDLMRWWRSLEKVGSFTESLWSRKSRWLAAEGSAWWENLQDFMWIFKYPWRACICAMESVDAVIAERSTLLCKYGALTWQQCFKRKKADITDPHCTCSCGSGGIVGFPLTEGLMVQQPAASAGVCSWTLTQ